MLSLDYTVIPPAMRCEDLQIKALVSNINAKLFELCANKKKDMNA